MSGFFTDTELAEATPAGCGHTCNLNRGCSPVTVTGEGRLGVLIVLDSPSPPSSSGMVMLRKTLALHCGVILEKDCWLSHALACPLPSGRLMSQQEITACRPNLLKTVRELQPKLIILLGHGAMSSVVGASNPKVAFGKARGFPLLCDKVFPDQSYPGTWLGVAMAPDQVERLKFDPVVHTVWCNSLNRFFDTVKEQYPRLPDPANCEIITRPERAERLLTLLGDRKSLFAFDYETTGLKPHAEGQRVVSVGFCPSFTASFAFDIPCPLQGSGWEGVATKWRKIMADITVPKVAHNVAFEWEWTRRFFKVVPRGWAGDTQVLAHLEDSRPGHSGLKVQSYLKFGVPEYTSTTDRFKRSSPDDNALHGCNAFNKMDKAPFRDRLQYNAVDALYTYWLFNWFKERGLVAPDGKDVMVYG